MLIEHDKGAAVSSIAHLISFPANDRAEEEEIIARYLVFQIKSMVQRVFLLKDRERGVWRFIGLRESD